MYICIIYKFNIYIYIVCICIIYNHVYIYIDICIPPEHVAGNWELGVFVIGGQLNSWPC